MARYSGFPGGTLARSSVVCPRYLRWLVVMVVCAAVLTGCVPINKASWTLVGDSIVVAICEPFGIAEELSLGTFAPGDAGDDRIAEGRTELTSGTQITLFEPPAGMRTVLDKSSADFDGQRLVLSVYGGESGIVLGVNWDELRKDQWINESGLYTDGPCD
jgi:hypothetical protein